MTIRLSNTKVCIGTPLGGLRPKGPEYFSPGKSFRRNEGNGALGKIEKMKSVRNGKMINGENFFRTELHIKNPNRTGIQPFRPQLKLLIEQRHYTDDFNDSQTTQGVALG